MKFACIEYSTKTGAAWKHRPERPNYLCDPTREIDPTSFGCYTSALAGEHIPLTGLIYGTAPGAPSVLQRLPQDLSRRFRGAFRPYALRPLERFDVLLLIYQISNDDELVRCAKRARATFPETILVSSSSPPFGRLRDYWKDHPQTAERYRAFVEATHFNMNVCRVTVPWYRAFTDVPSLYLPQPYPVEYAIQQAVGSGQWAVGTNSVRSDAPASDDSDSSGRGTPTDLREQILRGPRGRRATSGHGVPSAARDERGASRSEESSPGIPSVRLEAERRTDGRPVVYVAGDTVRPDIMTGHLVAKVLQQRHPEYLIRVTKTPEFSLNTAFLAGARYQVMPFRPWREQLRALASVRLVINTDLWWTRGRVPVDCAAAGVPCVGTSSDGQTELWPDLVSGDSVDLEALLDRAERALTDEAFRAQVVAQAQRRLHSYSYARTVERFAYALDLARSGRLSEWRDPVWEDDRLGVPAATH